MRTITLKSGHVVTFGEVYTHGMEVAFNEALTKGMTLRQEAGSVVVEKIDAGALDRAVDAVLSLMIENITKANEVVPYSPEWLSSLPQRDYLTLKEKVESVRSENENRKEAGKKNS